MKLLLFLTLLFIVYLCPSCILPPEYDITVNGYLDPDQPGGIQAASAIHLLQDPGADNPLLEKEVIQQIETYLKKVGFRITSLEEADHCIRFRYGLGEAQHLKSEYREVPGYSSFYGPRYDPWYRSYGMASVVTWIKTEYSMSLVLQLLDARAYRNNEPLKITWVGEALCFHSTPDLRTVIAYLLHALLPQFNQDTKKGIQITLKGV